MHSKQMLLGLACRVWRIGFGEHRQSLLTYTKHIAFLDPSLTPHIYQYTVGPRRSDFGHYPCRWLGNSDAMRPD